MSETREHILKTAFSLFLQKSYKEVTMKEIVEKTGMSKGAFYHYFASKENLFAEVVDTYYFQKMLINYSELNHNSLYEFYHDYIDHLKDALVGHKEILSNFETGGHINYITMLFDAIKLFPDAKDKMMNTIKDELQAWIKIVKLSRKKGEFTSPMTDEQIARMFIYSNDGIALRFLLEGKTEGILEEMLRLWDNFYKEILDEY